MKARLFIVVLLLNVFFGFDLFCQGEEETFEEHETKIENYRKNKNQQMMDSESSPLSSEQIERFDGLDYFPIDIKYKINAQIELEESSEEVNLNTTSGEKVDLIKFGTVTFEYKGDSYTMTVFQNKNLPEFGNDKQQLFIPFTDRSNGRKTNEKGRYLTIDVPTKSNTVVLDFNMAMNPYSAYSSEYSSVIPPAENTIVPSMSAGERKFEDR